MPRVIEVETQRVSPVGRPARPVRSRSGPRGPGTSSTRVAPSRSCIRCWCCSRPRRSDSRQRVARAGPPGAGASALVLSRFSFALRGRALLWLAALAYAAAAPAVAGPGSARGRARRYVVLHGRRLGLCLLPPAHRRALDERPAVLVPRAHELGSHQRQRVRAAAEAVIALSAGTLLAEEASAGSVLRSAAARGDRRGSWRHRRTLVRPPHAALSAAGKAGQPASGGAGPQGLRDRRGRLPTAAASGRRMLP